jgi:NAD(P)-dependent dehydrogenase (short-subunit alcohol dehydrogenase family)
MSELQGRVCLVTGAASGMGQVIATELARRGATVIVGARSGERVAGAIAEIERAAGGQGRLEGFVCDLASLASLRDATRELLARFPKIHLLVNNAAVFNGTRRTSVDGFELGFAVNNLAPFVLTNALMPALQAAAPSRIVMMTMATKARVDLDDLQAERGYNGFKALQVTKACEQYTARTLAKRLAGTGVSVVCVDPGLVKSKLPSEASLPIRILFKLFGTSPEQGARAPLSACLDDKWPSGAFVTSKGKARRYPSFMDDQSCAALWSVNEKLAAPALR